MLSYVLPIDEAEYQMLWEDGYYHGSLFRLMASFALDYGFSTSKDVRDFLAKRSQVAERMIDVRFSIGNSMKKEATVIQKEVIRSYEKIILRHKTILPILIEFLGEKECLKGNVIEKYSLEINRHIMAILVYGDGVVNEAAVRNFHSDFTLNIDKNGKPIKLPKQREETKNIRLAIKETYENHLHNGLNPTEAKRQTMKAHKTPLDTFQRAIGKRKG